jgi:hypothetical protein
MNVIFKKTSEKNLKMYITNACAQTPKTLWEKQEKAITYNVVIVTMKNFVGKNQEIDIILY